MRGNFSPDAGLVQTQREKPVAVAMVALRLAPYRLLPTGPAPLPPRQAPNGDPVTPHGAGAERRLLTPPPPAARTCGGPGGSSLGRAVRDPQVKTRRKTGGSGAGGGFGRALDPGPVSLRPREGARPALTGLSPCSCDAPSRSWSPPSVPQGDGRPNPARAGRPRGAHAARPSSRVSTRGTRRAARPQPVYLVGTLCPATA